MSVNGHRLFKVSYEYGRLLQAAKNCPGNRYSGWLMCLQIAIPQSKSYGEFISRDHEMNEL